MRQKAKNDTAEADIGKAIDVWDCRRSLAGGVIVDWRTWKSRRWGWSVVKRTMLMRMARSKPDQSSLSVPNSRPLVGCSGRQEC